MDKHLHTNEKKSLKVLGIGAPILDHILPVTEEYLKKVPGPKYGMVPVSYDQMISLIEKSGSVPKQIVGGSCANALRGLSSLGWHCGIAGKIGNDDVGQKVVNSLEAFQITPYLSHSKTPTSQVACLVSFQGKRTCRCYLGASQEMDGSDLKPRYFEGVKLVHIEGYSLLAPGLTQEAMRCAKEAGALISFDMGSYEIVEDHRKELRRLLAEYVDILFANEDEAKVMCGEMNGMEGSLFGKEACKSLRKLCPVAVVMIAEEGCWTGSQDSLFHTPAQTVSTVLDTTGAGDLFASGFLHGYLAGKPLSECARYGTLTAGTVIQNVGAEILDEQWIDIKSKMSL